MSIEPPFELTPERIEVQWCVACGARFTEGEVVGAQGCPECKSEGNLCDTEHDVSVEVNWHELRILCIWAESWAHQCKREGTGKRMPVTVAAIARRLQSQFPEFIPLTLAEEIAQLPQKLAGQIDGEIETNVPKPPLIPVYGRGAIGYTKKHPG